MFDLDSLPQLVGAVLTEHYVVQTALEARLANRGISGVRVMSGSGLAQWILDLSFKPVPEQSSCRPTIRSKSPPIAKGRIIIVLIIHNITISHYNCIYWRINYARR